MAKLVNPIPIPSTPAVIRSAVGDDAEALVAYLCKVTTQSDNLTFEADETDAFANEHHFLDTLEASENSLALLAMIEGNIVGNLTFMGGKRPKSAHTGEFGITVDREHWGKGIARALLAAMIEWAENSNITKINLEVRSDNHRAIRLYQTYGFIEEGLLKRALVINGEPFDLLCMGLGIGTTPPHVPIGEIPQRRTPLPRPVVIREMNSNDAQEVLSLVENIARGTPFLEIGQEGLGIGLTDEKMILSHYAKSDRKLYLGASMEHEGLVGLLAFTAGERRRTYHAGEFSLMVDQRWRRNGIGTALLQRMVNWAVYAGIKRITLRVHGENREAISLYQSFGFSREAVVSRAFLEGSSYYDAVVMSLLLD